MIRLWKRSISILLALVMVVGMIPTVAFAEEESLEEQPYVEAPVEEASVEEEPVEEEPVEEEPVEEEPVEEEPVEEEPVEEEPVDEEPVEEEPVEEEPVNEEPVVEEPAAEEPAQQKVTIMALAKQYIADVAAMAVAEDEDPDGYVWLDRNREESVLVSYIMQHGLATMILDALDMDDDHDVFFEFAYSGTLGMSGTMPVNMAVAPSGITATTPEEVIRFAAWQHLADQVTAGENVQFTVKNTEDNTTKNVVIGFRSINRVEITFEGGNEKTIAREQFDATEVKTAAEVFEANLKIVYDDKEEIPVATSGVKVESLSSGAVSGYWPEDGLEATVDPFITATIVDSVDGKTDEVATAKLILVDTTLVYVVQYNVDGTIVSSAPISIDKTKLEEEPTVATPTYANCTGEEAPSKQYYNFAGWYQEDGITAWSDTFAPSKDATQYVYITYEAAWKPIKDSDNDGTPDELDTYTITFMDGHSATPFKVFENVKWGEKVPVPTGEPASYDDNGTTLQFAGWNPDPYYDANNKPLVVNGKMTFTATWTGHCRVHFFMHDGTSRIVVVEKQSVEGGEPAAKVSSQEFIYQGKVSSGKWYRASAEGVSTGEEFDFRKTFTDANLYLVGEWLTDVNENGVKDGAFPDPDGKTEAQIKGDPIDHHIWLDKDEQKVHEVEWLEGLDESILIYNGYNPEGFYITKWETNIVTSTEEYRTTTTHTPIVVQDKNGNTVDDNLEIITITSTGTGTVTIDETKLVANGNNSYIYDSTDANAREIVITATPVVADGISKTIVSGIKVDETSVDPAYRTDHSVEYIVEDAALVKTVAVTFVDAVLTKNTNNTMRFIAGQMDGMTDEQKAEMEKAIYNTVVNSNVHDVNYLESLKYLAREESTEDVSVADIRKTIEEYELPESLSGMVSLEQFNSLKNKALAKIDERAPGGTFEIELDAVWLNVGQSITPVSMEKVISDAKNAMMASVTANPYAAVEDMNQVFDDFALTINANARMANCHPFGYNIGTGDTVEETLEIIYADAKMRVVDQEATIKLVDDRKATKITAEDMTVPYGTDVSEAALLAHAKLTDMDDNAVSGLQLDGDYKNLAPGITHTIFLKFPGNGDYKESAGSFKLTINKSNVTIAVNSASGSSAETIAQLAKPVIKNENDDILNVSDITGVHIIAGYDMSNVTDLNFENGQVTNVQAYAWIQMSENAKSMLTIQEKDYTLPELKTLLDQNSEALSAIMNPSQLNQITEALDKLDKRVNATLKVRFTDDPYPKNPGVYMNMVMAFDDLAINIKGENTAYNYIVFGPTFYVPNNGIQLTYNGDSSHKLDIPADAQNKTLTVKCGETTLQAGEYSLYFVGMTAEGEKYIGPDMPTENGVYLASAIDLTADGEDLRTDCALVTIGAQDANLTIPALTPEQETAGASYKATIDAAADAALTVISGTAGINDPSINMTAEEILANLYGTVNLEIPNALYGKLNEVWSLVFDGKAMPTQTNSTELLAALERIQTINNDMVNEALGGFNAIEGYVDAAMDYVNAAYNNLANVVAKIPPRLTISLGQERQTYSAAGVYAYVALVTDPAYTPDMDAGLLVIENSETFELQNTKVTYDAQEHLADLIDEIGSDYMTVIKQGNELNFLLEQNLEKAVIEKLEQWANKELPEAKPMRVSVAELRGEGETLSEKLTDFILEWVAAKAEAKILGKFGDKTDSAYQYAMSTLEDWLIPAARTYLLDKFQNAAGLDNGQVATIVLNGPKPVDVGTYEFFSVSYGVAVTGATLEIVPIEVIVNVNNIETYYGNEFEYTYDTNLSEVALDVDQAKLDITYTIQPETDGKSAGKHAFTADAKVLVNDEISDHYKVTVKYTDVENPAAEAEAATLNIKPAEYTITVSQNLEKIFDQADPDFTAIEDAYTITCVNGQLTDAEIEALKLQIVRKVPKNVDEQKSEALNSTVEMTATYVANPNVTIEVVEGLMTNTLGDYVCWNTETEIYYSTVTEGLFVATSGQEVEVLKDFTASEYGWMIKPGVTLDLNGHTVAAMYVAGLDTAHLIDSTDGAGRLITDLSTLTLDEENDMLPTYDGESAYIFTKPYFAIGKDNSYTGDGYKIRALPAPAMNIVEMYKDGTTDNNNDILVRLTWDTDDGVKSQDFTYNQDVIMDVYQSNGGSQFSYARRFNMVITGVDSVKNLRAYIVLASGTDAERVYSTYVQLTPAV